MRKYSFGELPSRKSLRTREKNVCECFNVPVPVIECAIRLLGLKTVAEVTAATGAGGGCHGCAEDIEEILARCARGEYTVQLSEEDYRFASRAYVVPPPSESELAANAKVSEWRGEKT